MDVLRKLCLLSSTILLIPGAAPVHAADDREWGFEDAPVGELAPGWSAAKTGEGPGSLWRVLEDDSAPSGTHVLTQTSSAGPNRLFNLCVADDTEYQDLEVTVSLKAVTGRFDRGGGPVWRYRDENNYYVARHNPLENNYRLYKVVDGRRTQLGTADVTIPSGTWYTLRVVHRGSHIQCFLNDEPYLDVMDDTFTEAGRVGLWSKADAVTRFDDFHVQSLDE